MRNKLLFFSFFLLITTTSMVMSQTVARESFEYPKGATVDTLTGTTQNGFIGAWHKDTGVAKLSVVADTALNYSNLAYAIPNTGNHLTSNTLAGNWANSARYKRQLDKTWPDTKGTSYWMSYILEFKKAPNTDGNLYVITKLYKDNSEVLAIGKGGGGNLYSCGSGWPGGSGPDVSTIKPEAGPVWLVVRMDMSGDSKNERTYMWIDPDPNKTPDTTKAAVKRNSTANDGFNYVAIEFGGADANLVISWDEIRLGTSFADVSSKIVTTYLARESFEYTKGATVDTLTGVSKNGFTGAWHKDTGVAKLSVVADTALNYSNLAYAIPNIGNHLTSNTLAGNWANSARYKRQLDKTWPDTKGTSYWMSYILEFKKAPNTDGNLYVITKIYKDNSEVLAIGKGGGGNLYSCGSGWPGGSGPDVSTIKPEAGPVWLVTRMDMSGDSKNERTYMWIDPDPNKTPDTTKAAVKRNSTANDGFNYVAIEFGGADANLVISWDEIRLGTSFADVSTKYTAIAKDVNAIPVEFALQQNYPNPFNPSTKISYSLKNNDKVRLTVYDMLGREIAVLVDGQQNAGQHEVSFNASDLSSGVYCYRLQISTGVISKKMMLIK